MAITKHDARQQVISAWADFDIADLTSATFAAAIEVPMGAVVVGGRLVIDTAFDSGTTDVITVGDTVDDDEYKTNGDGQSATAQALVPTGYVYTAKGNIGIKWTSDGTAPTEGAGRLFVEYVVTTRTQFTQG